MLEIVFVFIQMWSQMQEEKQQLFKNFLNMAIWQQRHLKVSEYVQELGITRVMDIGCSNAELLVRLSRCSDLTLLVGVDVDDHAINLAKHAISPETIQDNIAFHREHPLELKLYQCDALKCLPPDHIQMITLIEVIQHVQQSEVNPLSDVIFGKYNPQYVVITTPNKDFNVHFAMDEKQFRHYDHKFQWTQDQFKKYCQTISEKYSFTFNIFGVGQHISDPQFGMCSQGALFTRKGERKFQPFTQESYTLVRQVRYPFWKDNLEKKIQNLVRHIIWNKVQLDITELVSLFQETTLGEKLKKENIKIDEQQILKVLEGNSYCIVSNSKEIAYIQQESSESSE